MSIEFTENSLTIAICVMSKKMERNWCALQQNPLNFETCANNKQILIKAIKQCTNVHFEIVCQLVRGSLFFSSLLHENIILLLLQSFCHCYRVQCKIWHLPI